MSLKYTSVVSILDPTVLQLLLIRGFCSHVLAAIIFLLLSFSDACRVHRCRGSLGLDYQSAKRIPLRKRLNYAHISTFLFLYL
jgi:hypothetical protein